MEHECTSVKHYFLITHGSCLLHFREAVTVVVLAVLEHVKDVDSLVHFNAKALAVVLQPL